MMQYSIAITPSCRCQSNISHCEQHHPMHAHRILAYQVVVLFIMAHTCNSHLLLHIVVCSLLLFSPRLFLLLSSPSSFLNIPLHCFSHTGTAHPVIQILSVHSIQLTFTNDILVIVPSISSSKQSNVIYSLLNICIYFYWCIGQRVNGRPPTATPL